MNVYPDTFWYTPDMRVICKPEKKEKKNVKTKLSLIINLNYRHHHHHQWFIWVVEVCVCWYEETNHPEQTKLPIRHFLRIHFVEGGIQNKKRKLSSIFIGSLPCLLFI